MADETKELRDQLGVDSSSLYREETVTDLKLATIRRLIPITSEGEADPDRSTVFVGQTQIMSQLGPIPVQAKIDADSLEEAMERFADTMSVAVEEMLTEAREAQLREANRIVPPPGGGKIIT